MRRIGLFLSAAMLICCLAGCSSGRPFITLEVSQNSVIAHVETLGEYPTTVSHIRLTERQSGTVVLELQCATSPCQIHKLTLKAGENKIQDVLPESDGYPITVPQKSTAFTLSRDTDYLLQMWGTASRPAQITIRIPK